MTKINTTMTDCYIEGTASEACHIVNELRADRTLKGIASAIGFSHGHLRNVLSGNQKPSDRMLIMLRLLRDSQRLEKQNAK